MIEPQPMFDDWHADLWMNPPALRPVPGKPEQDGQD